MKQASFILIVFMLLFQLINCNNFAISEENSTNVTTSAQYEKGYRYNIQGWIYIHIEGEPYERGYQYGYLASAEIVDMMKRWSNFGHNLDFMKLFVFKARSDNYYELSEHWWNICRSKSVSKFLKQIPDEYDQEIRGIVDGINAKGGKIFGRDVEYEDIVASQLVQEVWYSCRPKSFYKQFHPARSLIYGVKELISGDMTNHEPGHCSAFIATGDATSDGSIVASHSTEFHKYIAERCNIILDVQPSEGYRFVMTCPPGSIWSQEDFYQNEKGIILTETELPQGPWTYKGIPKGVRSRKAIQYSDSIDEIIETLKQGNNGLIPNEWLIGDAKTGEIASFEQALFNSRIKRTFDGMYWSTNVPNDKKVKRELFGIIDFSQITSKTYYDTYDRGRNEKFKELSKEYYGKIDTEIAKTFLSTDPICNGMTDGKITSSSLIDNLELIAFMGVPNGETWIPTGENKEMFHGVTDLPPCGWVNILPHNIKQNNNLLTASYDDNSIEKDGVVYFGSDDGFVYAAYSDNGNIKWKYETGWAIDSTPALEDGMVFVGSLDNNFYAINQETGELEWFFNCNSAIHSSPYVYGEYVFFGSDDGKLYALNKTNGEFAWSFAPKYSIEDKDVNNYVTTPILSDPIVKDGVVYITVEGETYELDSRTIELKKDKVDLPSDRGYAYYFFLLILASALVLFFYMYKRTKERK